jgi:D-tyrosyl-tRNA(Tyr) deacylase
MRALLQRVSSASVYVGDELVSEIGHGILTLLGVKTSDTQKDAEWLVRKIIALRIFEDDQRKMNRSLLDTNGSHLIVSQFTLWADASKGNRPSYLEAARPEMAKALYEHAIAASTAAGVPTLGGRFQAHMRVNIVNDGPVTIFLSSAPE